jgi:hypothetical protein
VRPGDTVSASTTVAGHAVTFRIRDLTTEGRYSTTRHASSTDVSTAEWILEAPSACLTTGGCTALPLTNIGAVQFASATARSATQARAADDAAWSNTTLELEQASVSLPSYAQAQIGPVRTVVSAAPSSATQPYGAFSISMTEQASQLSIPQGPTLPGFAPG